MNKILLILFFILGVALMLLLFLSSILTRTTPQEKAEPTPTRVSVHLPTLRPNELAILSHLPKEVPDTPYLPMQKITLNFSDNILAENVEVTTDPLTPFSLIQGKNKKTVYIVPTPFWAQGKTTITVLTTTTSSTGKKLSYPYILSIITGPPPTLDPDINVP